jgi:mannose-1-phosphate guanylyltransferase
MKVVIFAGGTGRRLWPLSRKRSPKQFEPIIGERSTVQLAVDRVRDQYGPENIYISTNERYQEIIRGQLPELPPENVIGEPTRRDLAAAVGLAMIHLQQSGDPDEPVAILWGDNYMTEVPTFLQVLGAAEKLLSDDKAGIVFVGETPRFANNNLGWIGLGETVGSVDGRDYFAFNSWVYRPPLDECERMFNEGGYVWNTGYFVTTLGYISQLYADHQPEMWAKLGEIGAAIGREDYTAVLHAIYPQLESLHFDDAIARHVPRDKARVLHGKMGWSDPGTLYALKEAINPDPKANVTKGLVLDHGSQDSLLYNYEGGKLLAAVGLQGMVVVNTEDAILVVHKDQIPLVKELVDGLEGADLENYS